MEAKDAGAFREVAVVTNVHADAGVTRLKDGITGVSGREVKFFPKTGMAMRYVVLAVFAQIAAVSVDDRGGVVINAGHFHFVDWHDKRHLIFFRKFLHERDGGAFGDALGELVPASFLFGAKIRTIKKLLEAEDSYFFLGGGGDEVLVLGDHLLFYV